MQSIPPNIEQQTERVMDLVTEIVATFHNTQDFDKSCKIIKKNQMDRLGMIFIGAKASDMSRLLLNLMRTAWNSTPLASNHYRPSPLPELNRNDKCWCGSGLKYKQCCLRDTKLLIPIDSTTIWSFLLQALSPSEIKDAMNKHAIPASVLVYQAIEDVEAGDYRNALKKLEPLFDQKLDKANEDTCYAVNLLCNTYDELGMQSEKIDFLEKIKNTGSKPLRSEAWQRLATLYIDQGDNDAAWDAFHTARHLDHTNPGIDLLEVSLLMGEKNLQKAQERAKFILRRMRKNGTYEDDELTQYLERIAADPEAGYEELYEDQELKVLSDWIEEVKDRPVPAYKVSEMPPFDIDDEVGDFANRASRKDYTYETPAKLKKLEKQWQKVFQGVETFGLNTLPSDISPWDDDAWLDFIQKHPECFDSIDILDDITLAVKEWEPNDWILQNLLIPLGIRAAAIYEKLPVPGSFSWYISQNRPLIRTLYNLSDTLHDAGEIAASYLIYKILLEANPDDNHGIRCYLMNQSLFEYDHEEIKKLLKMYPDDILIDIQMGRILNLMQNKNKTEAKKYWLEVQARYPYIKHYMVSAKVTQPKAGQYGVTVGSKEEAWEYRQVMRETWLRERGVIEWLKKT